MLWVLFDLRLNYTLQADMLFVRATRSWSPQCVSSVSLDRLSSPQVTFRLCAEVIFLRFTEQISRALLIRRLDLWPLVFLSGPPRYCTWAPYYGVVCDVRTSQNNKAWAIYHLYSQIRSPFFCSLWHS